jgi:hypothetical protein
VVRLREEIVLDFSLTIDIVTFVVLLVSRQLSVSQLGNPKYPDSAARIENGVTAYRRRSCDRFLYGLVESVFTVL